MFGIGGQEIEHIVYRAGDLRIGGQQAQIGVDSRRIGVVIARSEVSVAAGHAVIVSTHQQRQFAMSLQADQAVEHLHPGIFQIARPADVGSLVEARLQFHHRRHFLRLRCSDQGGNDQGMLVGAVERLLDGKHSRISSPPIR